jgi:hypothetical protein
MRGVKTVKRPPAFPGAFRLSATPIAIDQEEGMPLETTSLFATVIQEHLELRRRNAALEHEMPLRKYMPHG